MLLCVGPWPTVGRLHGRFVAEETGSVGLRPGQYGQTKRPRGDRPRLGPYFFLRLGALALPPALAAGAVRFLLSAARSVISFWIRSNSDSSISWKGEQRKADAKRM